MRVKNRRCIIRLSFRQFRAAKTRNLIAVFAIALTTLLFTSLFTIAFSINASYEEFNFRQIGGYSHGAFKDVTPEQIARLSQHKKVREYGLRSTFGFLTEAPFAKKPAEISWMDANTAKWSYATPTTGRLPQSGMEIAMDTEALRLLQVPAKLGEPVRLTYAVTDQDGSMAASKERTAVFTLVGFWEYDTLMPVHYINTSEEYMQQVAADFAEAGSEPLRTDMNVMLSSSLNIRAVMESIDTDLGYQWEDRSAPNCVRIGSNWGYSASSVSSGIDASTLTGIAAFLLLVIFTGYLIIYNIFQISVSNDIRFYGLLKTIGTTPRQLKRIVRCQALYLSAVGIPVGCALGYAVGAVLMPKIVSTSILSTVRLSASPLIFVGAALFSLLTVRLSCARPGKKAAAITPVEAVRYTEHAVGTKSKRATRGAKIPQMAFANLGRNRLKTTLVVLSLSLAVVLLNCVFLFLSGFDMEKYVSSFSVADFIVGTPDYFRFNASSTDAALSEESIAAIQSNTDASLEGAAYTLDASYPKGWLKEAEYRSITGAISEETWQQITKRYPSRNDLFAADVLLEGLDAPLLEKLIVYEGSLEPLQDPAQNAIALAASQDDHGALYSTPKKVGDTLTITYIDEARWFDRRTGEPSTEDTPEDALEYRTLKSHDVTYTVCALVGIPYGMSHRFSSMTGFEAIVTKDALLRDSALPAHKMFYLFDTPDEAAEAAAEEFLAAYTAGDASGLMYESKAMLRADFGRFQSMFLMVGSALCIIVGLVGILNFFNAILTGILTRHREFAMLQSVGMTGRQLKQMLICEGCFYAAGAGLLSLVLSLLFNPLAGKLLGKMFWFFSYHFTILPVLAVLPLFLLLGVLLPLVIYKFSAKKSIVERLRETE